MSDRPRIRVNAGDASGRSARPSGRAFVGDSFQNFLSNIGIGTNNQASAATYGFNPVSRERVKLEYMYRGSWLVKQVVDSVADDMTRAGIDFPTDSLPPDRIDLFTRYLRAKAIWERINQTIKWARLYGGCLAVIMVDGQKFDTPLRVETISKNQFQGLMVLDRWMVQPALDEVVTDFGPSYGLPKYYDITQSPTSDDRIRLHYSRCIRFDGVELPFWQRISENSWGMSVVEPIFDRLIAFDSATQGAAQLVYRAHLRTLKIENLRELIATGGAAYQAMLDQMQLIRLLQSNEGVTLLDSQDDFQTYQYSFSGLSDMLVQFGQQVSGASQIPMTRLFGQSPAGMNSTGESDMRNYYDSINAQQEARLRLPLGTLFEVCYRSLLNEPLPKDFNFTFRSLWQMSDTEKSQIASSVTTTVSTALMDGIVDRATAMRELRQSSRTTGIWSNITDESIKEAENEMPPAPEGEIEPQQDAATPAPLPQYAGEGNPQEIVKQIVRENLPKYVGSGDPKEIVRQLASDSLLPMRDVHGLPVVIETHRGTARSGNGWSVLMPCDYGYIQGTSSAEGPTEQMDCYVGPDIGSPVAFIIDQMNAETGEFDEHKVMLGYSSQQAALDDYLHAHSDGKGIQRMGGIRHKTIEELKGWLREWRYGKPRLVS